MTFTEAAAQVLRLVGKPLHYKEITDVAIEKNLLSHVGKSPEVTMGARLAALVKKGDKENPLVRVKPGVFALREWDQDTIERGLADRTPALEIAKNVTIELPPMPPPAAPEGAEADAASSPAQPLPDEDEEEPRRFDADERERAELAASATQLFAPEEDDDVPIFAAPEEDGGEEDDEAGAAGRDAGARRRRRRRRRGRGPDEPRGADDLPSYTMSDAPAGGVELAEVAVVERRDDRGDRGGDRGDRGGDRDRDRDRNRDRDRDRDRDRRPRAEAASFDDLAGRDLADAVAQLLSSFDRSSGGISLGKLVEAALRRGKLAGDTQQAQSLLLASVRADNLRRQAQGQRPQFRLNNGRIGLSEWALDGDLARSERELGAVVDRYRDAARRLLLRRIQELPPRALGELALLLLERSGISELKPVRRAGAPGGELHLSGTLRGPAGELRLAIVIRRDGREIGRERVTELRGALHHYAAATAGYLVTTGQVLSGAREEAAAASAAPVHLLDGQALAKLCEEQGVGVLKTRVELSIPDLDLFEALRSS
jgi:restriction endonuclease Mrr